MYLSDIHIENFKKIKNADFEFTRDFNLIIGDNGTGKTSILEAIAVFLGGYLAGIDGVNTIHFSKDEICRENELLGDGSNNIQYRTPIKVSATLLIEGQRYYYTRQKKAINSSRSTVEPKEIRRLATEMVKDSKSVLPIISYQSFSRISNQKKDKWEDPFSSDFSRVIGYVDCLEEASNTKMLTNWCKRMEQIAWQKEKKIMEYEAVKEAVAQFMQLMLEQKNIKIFYDKRTEELMYSNASEELPIRLLSSGFRTLLGMVFDIAYRMAILNPHLMNKIITQTPGIVLIDEVDMHLHPKWQWKVVDALKKTFPLVQFIATTHSPMIISSCKDENLIILEPEDVFLDKPEEIQRRKTVKGWLVDDVLREYMDSENRDPETIVKLNDLTKLAKKRVNGLISEGELLTYHALIRELKSLLPEYDIAIEEAALLSIEELIGENR